MCAGEDKASKQGKPMHIKKSYSSIGVRTTRAPLKSCFYKLFWLFPLSKRMVENAEVPLIMGLSKNTAGLPDALV
jgi:hypothetical protein